MGKKKKQQNPCCEMCTNFIPIGEGDHICDEDPTMKVVSDYAPTDEYLWCGGKRYTKN